MFKSFFMKKNLKKLLIAGVVIAVATVNVKAVLDDKESEKLLRTSIATIAESSEGVEFSGEDKPVYKRNEGSCTISGKGRIEVFNVGVMEIDGELTIEGKVSCHAGGDALCSTVDCKDLYMWTNR